MAKKNLDKDISIIQALFFGHVSEDKLFPYPDLDSDEKETCLLYTSPSPRDATLSRMPSSA